MSNNQLLQVTFLDEGSVDKERRKSQESAENDETQSNRDRENDDEINIPLETSSGTPDYFALTQFDFLEQQFNETAEIVSIRAPKEIERKFLAPKTLFSNFFFYFSFFFIKKLN